MVLIDFFLIFIIFASLIFGFYRGFVRELLALIGLFFAFYCANQFSNFLITYVPFNFSASVNQVIVYLLIFIAVLIISGLIIKLINRFIMSVGLSFINIFMGPFHVFCV